MGARKVLSTSKNWMSGLRMAVLTNRLKAGATTAFAGFVAMTSLIMPIAYSVSAFGTKRVG
jgi:hypothetical protein